jgi:hypothetical protein
MSMIWYLAIKRIEQHLKNTINQGVSNDKDPLYVDIIKLGRYLENPTQKGVIVTLNSGDIKDPYFVDGIVSASEIEKIGFNIPTWEIGGGNYWWRRGRAELGCWYVSGNKQPTEDIAADRAYAVLGKLIKGIESVNLRGLEDEFGEGAVRLFVVGSNFYESGGNQQFIWRGAVKFQILTWRP